MIVESRYDVIILGSFARNEPTVWAVHSLIDRFVWIGSHGSVLGLVYIRALGSFPAAVFVLSFSVNQAKFEACAALHRAETVVAAALKISRKRELSFIHVIALSSSLTSSESCLDRGGQAKCPC